MHQINRPRLEALTEHLAAHFGRDRTAAKPFEGLTLIDIGLWRGTSSASRWRAWDSRVTGIDAGAKNIEVARLHAQQSGLSIEYRTATPEQIEGQFDVVLSMEVVEHVPDIDAFLSACGACLKTGGAFCGATLNRTGKSFALAIVGAEYVLRWLPRGTHDWRKFVRPSEFSAALRKVGITVKALEGVAYDPWRDIWNRVSSVDVNYFLYGVKG